MKTNNTEKILTLMELFQMLREKGWKQVDMAKHSGIKSQNLAKMNLGLQKHTSFQRYFALKDLLTKEPPVIKPRVIKTRSAMNLKHYMKGIADGVASVKEGKHG